MMYPLLPILHIEANVLRIGSSLQFTISRNHQNKWLFGNEWALCGLRNI